jgi:hypothetical protein
VADDFTFPHENNLFCDIGRKVSQSFAMLLTIDSPSNATGSSINPTRLQQLFPVRCL